MPWDADFWSGVMGTATEKLGGLFDDLGFQTPQSWGGMASTQAPAQDWGWLQPKQETPTWGWLGASSTAPARPNPFTAMLQQPKPSPSGGAPVGSAPSGGAFAYETPFAAAPGTEVLVEMARQVARETGIDPEVFVRQIGQESNFNPRAQSGAGAKGLGQLMDPTARSVGVTDPFDPRSNLMGSAKYLKQQLDKYGGDYTKALAAYNMGPGALDARGGVPFGESAAYVNRILAGAKRKEAAEASPATPGAPASGAAKPLRDLTTAQYGTESLATGAADYICGPIAAQAFARFAGRNPTLQESLNIARDMGIIDAKNGSYGIDNTARLVRQLGGVATVSHSVNEREAAGELLAGRPVIFNTPKHYFVAEDYDPQTGKFDLAESAQALGIVNRQYGGNTWYTIKEIEQLQQGAVRGAIYAR